MGGRFVAASIGALRGAPLRRYFAGTRRLVGQGSGPVDILDILRIGPVIPVIVVERLDEAVPLQFENYR